MNQLHRILRFLLVTIVVFYGGWSYGAEVLTAQSQKNLEAVVKKFAGSFILGTGASHFVTSMKVIDAGNAVAIVGELGDSGRQPDAYTVYVKQIKRQWKVVRYEYVFIPTGKKESRVQSPPFPYPNWEKDAP